MRLEAIVGLVLLSCDSIPEKRTLIAEGVRLTGPVRFTSENDDFVLQFTRARDGQGFEFVEEKSFSRYFSTTSPAAFHAMSGDSWAAVGTGAERFVLVSGSGENTTTETTHVGFWSDAGQGEALRCGQGPSQVLVGAAEMPVVYAEGYQCGLGCEVTPGSDAALRVGSPATHSFVTLCARDYLAPKLAVPTRRRFVLHGPGFIRVEEVSPTALVTIATRPVPEGVTEVLGLFEDELVVLAHRGEREGREVVEFDLRDGGVHPSRFALPLGFTVKEVFRPAPDTTLVYGWEWGASTNSLKRAVAEGAWSLTLPPPNNARELIAVSRSAVVRLQLEPTDAGLSNVWIQKFPF